MRCEINNKMVSCEMNYKIRSTNLRKCQDPSTRKISFWSAIVAPQDLNSINLRESPLPPHHLFFKNIMLSFTMSTISSHLPSHHLPSHHLPSHLTRFIIFLIFLNSLPSLWVHIRFTFRPIIICSSSCHHVVTTTNKLIKLQCARIIRIISMRWDHEMVVSEMKWSIYQPSQPSLTSGRSRWHHYQRLILRDLLKFEWSLFCQDDHHCWCHISDKTASRSPSTSYGRLNQLTWSPQKGSLNWS